MRGKTTIYARQMSSEYEEDANARIDWVATSWRPDPISLEPREIIIGKGFSNRRDTINILLDAIPIVDSDNFCRLLIRPADNSPIMPDWPQKWTALAYRTERSGATKKTVLGSGWIEDNEILVCLDALPTPNQNVECWLALKPTIQRINNVKEQTDF
jgi:hypothetical protein